MKTPQKLLLSLPSVLSGFYMTTFMFPTKFGWLFPDMNSYNIQMIVLNLLVILQIVILLKRLWRYKVLPKQDKTNWTWLLIFFSSITCLIYIWKKDSEFEERNLESKSEGVWFNTHNSTLISRLKRLYSRKRRES